VRAIRASRALPPLAATAALFVGCSGLLGIEDVSPWDGGAGGTDGTIPQDAASEPAQDSGGDVTVDSATDTGKDSASSESGAMDTGTPEGGGSDAPLCGTTTLYVSTTGSDANPGCMSAPKKTIAAAIAAAKTAGTVTTIEVCTGTYSTPPLTLDVGVSLLGGFDCTLWQRTSTYGYPVFDGMNATTLAYELPDAGPTPVGTTLTVTGPIHPTIDGFTISGPSSGSFSTTSGAVLVSGGSSPTLSNDQLQGGGTTYTNTGTGDPTPATAGVVVTNSATPTITADVIRGGSGTTKAGAGNGSVGVYADGTNGNVAIDGCTIHGGTGQAIVGGTGTGSSGVVIEPSVGTGPTYTIHGSAIDGGSGQNGTRATRGVYADSGGNAALVLQSSSVDGGDEVNNPNGATTGVLCPKGVEFLAGGSVTATGNRIYGGRCNIPTPQNSASLYGLFVGGSATAVVENNMIHMGTSTIPHGAGALVLGTTAGARIVHNTLIAGPAGAASIGALWLQNGATSAVIENNILAASGGAPTATGLLVSCPSGTGVTSVQSFQNNLVFGTTSGLMQWETCNGAASYGSIDAVDAELVATQPGVTAKNNLTLAPSCTTDAGVDSGCILTPSCTSQGACLTTVFSGFDTASLGYANLFPTTGSFAGQCPALAPPSGYGWYLAATPPCALAHSTLNDSMTVPLDLYGNCRTSAATSIGAAQYVGTCQ